MNIEQKETLFNNLDNLEIKREGNTIITYYYGREIKTATVSNRYEIFDFGPFAKEKVEQIVNKFDISDYRLSIKGGKQELVLMADQVDIKGKTFEKRFYILSSSDKTRRLQINYGLFCKDENYTQISSQGSVSRKHLTGLNQKVNQSLYVDSKAFEEQIELTQKLIGDTIKYSQIRRAILELDKLNFEDVKKTNFRKLDAFNKRLRWYNRKDNYNVDLLRVMSSEISEISNEEDFEMDAFEAFKVYLKLFKNKDSYEIKKETERISKITKTGFRQQRLEKLFETN